MPTSPRRPLLQLLASLAAAVAAALALWLAHPPRPLGPTPDWPLGRRLVYRVDYAAHTDVDLTGAPGGAGARAGGAALDGELVLDVVARDAGGVTLAASLRRLGRHEVAPLGDDALPDDATTAAQLVGATAWAHLGPYGALDRVQLEPTAPPLFKQLVQQLLRLAQVTVPDAYRDGWAVDEAGPFGRARVEYRRSGAILERRRVAYDALTVVPPGAARAQWVDGGGRILLAAGGWPAALADDETLRVDGEGGRRVAEARSHLALALVADEPAPPTPPAPPAPSLSWSRIETRRPGPDGRLW
jgi:hypothetical protein